MVIILSLVSSICPVEEFHKLFYVHAKNSFFQYQLLKAAQAGQNVYENEYNKLNNMKYARKLNGNITIQEIFKNHWDEFVLWRESNGKKLRPSIIKNVDAMINCRNFKKGYLFFECPKCNNIHVQGLSCHSRFCVSCGKKYRDARANEISKTCIYAPHRHLIWTISGSLWDYFQKYKEMNKNLYWRNY